MGLGFWYQGCIGVCSSNRRKYEMGDSSGPCSRHVSASRERERVRLGL